jgi:hypothetical protein
MNRAAAIRRSTTAALLTLACACALTAVAVAAKPVHGAHFKGRTSAAPVVGFFAPVNFVVSADGRSLKGFSYGSFGCQGAGGFRPGVNPYTGGSIFRVAGIKVSPAGHFSVSGAKSKFSIDGQITTTTSAVTGHFTKGKVATGSITFSQKFGGSLSGGCGPAKITFTATAH